MTAAETLWERRRRERAEREQAKIVWLTVAACDSRTPVADAFRVAVSQTGATILTDRRQEAAG